MIWLVSFGLSAGFIAAGAVCFFIRRKQGKNEVRYLGAGVFLASVTACYPVMRLSEQVGFAAAMSVSQGIRMYSHIRRLSTARITTLHCRSIPSDKAFITASLPLCATHMS